MQLSVEQREDSAAAMFQQDAARQVARARASGVRPRVAIALHLGQLAPPAPRPHHRRVARALMQDTASWHEGQVFPLPNGDLALICLAGSEGDETSSRVAHPSALPAMLRQLLRIDTPAGCDLVSVWPLDTHGDQLLAYAQAILGRRHGSATGRSATEEDFAGQTGAADALGGLIGAGAITDLMQRQSAVILGQGADGNSALRPLYHEVTFSIAGLEGRVAPGSSAASDPFLFRHLAAKLDRRLLEALCHEIGRGGPLDLSNPGPHALHLNLTVPGILSADFTRLIAAGRFAPGRVGVEISLLEAVADWAAFSRARDVLAQSGFSFVLDGVSHLALLMTRPALIGADLIKLDWSPRITELPEAELAAVGRGISEIGASRVVLHRAETEAALRWGLSRGIRRFQGRHVDAMLGASRIMGCGFAERCALRQCIDRAGATSAVGRSGCQNLMLLDAGTPQNSETGAAFSRRSLPSEALA